MKLKNKKRLTCFVASLCLLLSACAKDIAPGDYDSSDVGKIKKVVPGVILSKRPVRIHNKTAENTPTTPDNNAGASPATPATSDNNITHRSHGFEYVIRLNSGAIISLVQTEDVSLKAKQHVLVIYSNNTRVVPDDGSDEY